MTPDTDVKPVAAASITSWDDEAGVVIAGYGVAGAPLRQSKRPAPAPMSWS